MAELYGSGQHRIDFANASAVELLAFCVASEIEDRNKLSGRPTRPATGHSRMLRSGVLQT
jgi:hypothetical protein